MKKNIAILALGLLGTSAMAESINDLPSAHKFGDDNKKEAKKKKKRSRELARRQKRLDNIKKE